MNPLSIVAFVAALIATVSAAAAPAPFPVPAKYKLANTPGMEIEFRPDGTYSYTTYLKCLAANCVGSGAYFYNRDSRTLHLRQRIEGRSTVSQYWQLGNMSRDADVSLIWNNKLVQSSGVDADLYPIPAKQAGELWTRV